MPKGVLWPLDDWIRGPLGVRSRGDDPETLLATAVEAAVAGGGRVLPAPPLMHGSGTWSAIGGLCRGRTVVIQDVVTRFDAADVVATIARERVTSTMIIGDAFARPLVAALEAGTDDVSSLRTILNSGAALHPTRRTALERLCPGVRIVDTVGSSESGPQASRTAADDDDVFALTLGAAVLVEDRSRVMGDGEEGEGWLAQAGRLPLGYLDHPEATARTFPTIDGVRRVVPGDKVWRRADGRVRFLGRDATTINTGGEKVFAEEVELVLRGLPGVRDALVTGRPSERWGSEVTALVELEPGVERSEDDIRTAAREGLADYKVPKAVLLVEVRRLPNGKADTSWARATAAASVGA
jgi:fatty-acyl-CoA synthase